MGRGGVQQRMAQASLASSEGQIEPNESKLAQKLLYLFAWGYMTAETVQQIAQAAEADGLQHESIKKMSKIGAGGQAPRHCRQQLMNLELHRNLVF